MNYEFNSCLFRNSSEMHNAMVAEWLCASGSNEREVMLEALANLTDQELVDEIWDNWSMERDPDSNDAPFSKEEALEAFADLRKNFDEIFPTEDDY